MHFSAKAKMSGYNNFVLDLHFSLLQIVVPLITPSKLGIFARCLQMAKIHQLEPLWSPKLSLTFASQIEQFLVDEFMLCIPPLQCGQKIQNISFSTISAVEHLGHYEENRFLGRLVILFVSWCIISYVAKNTFLRRLCQTHVFTNTHG